MQIDDIDNSRIVEDVHIRIVENVHIPCEVTSDVVNDLIKSHS